jgi:hypothetical protein
MNPLEFKLPPIHLEYDAAKCDTLIARHILGATAIGLDIEWRPTGSFFNGSGKPALLQLATPYNVVLVPLAHLTKPLPSLKKLLRDNRCFAVGVSVLEDVMKLPGEGGELGMEMRCVDIALAGSKAGVLRGRIGLAGLVAELGGPIMEKPKKVQMSDWEARNLTPAQVEYASLDAYASGWGAAGVFNSIRSKTTSSSDLCFVSWMADVAKVQAGEFSQREALKKKLMASAGESLSGGAWMDYAQFSGLVIDQCREEIATSSKDPKYILSNFVTKLLKKKLVEVETTPSLSGSEMEERGVKKIRRAPGRRW